MGFNLTDVDVLIRKGHLIFNAGYVKIRQPEQHVLQVVRRGHEEGPHAENAGHAGENAQTLILS